MRCTVLFPPSMRAGTVAPMTRSVTAENWCKVCFFSIVFGFGVVIALLIGHWIRPAPVPLAKNGWCCLHQGQLCRSSMDAMECGNRGGFAYTFDEGTCQTVCASLPPTHGAQPKQP